MITITHINYDESQSFQNSPSNVPFIGPAISYSYFSNPELDLTEEDDKKEELFQAVVWSLISLIDSINTNTGSTILNSQQIQATHPIIRETINFEWPNATDNQFPTFHFNFQNIINKVTKTDDDDQDTVTCSGDFIFTIV